MKKEIKIKIILGLVYLVIISGFLWLLFSNFSLKELSSYDFIKNNTIYFNQLRESNFLLVSILFLTFTIIWVLFLGFGTPILLIAGFIFGKWIGSFYAIIGLTVGATLLYIFANYFLKDFIEENFSKKFSNLKEKFKKNEFNFFLIYRFVGGIPFAISNILPTIFNIKLKNFFFGSLLGMYPQVFIWVSLGSGLNKIIENNLEPPTLTKLLFSPEIYIPIIGFIILVILGIIFKNIYYNK
tara:strand:- start:75 stop:794 length:720 start_codon:yes stop_codon:yes gene_type:complete